MDYQVVLSPSARADLRDIVRYISSDAPDRALEFGLFLVSRTRLLAQSPQLGRIVPELKTRSFARSLCARIGSSTASTNRAVWSRLFAFSTPHGPHQKSTRDH